jgi:hypothetical protein
MQITVKSVENGFSRKDSFAAHCDHCGEVITKHDAGNLVYEKKEGAEVFAVHKRCNVEFVKKQNKEMVWMDLDDFVVSGW